MLGFVTTVVDKSLNILGLNFNAIKYVYKATSLF